REALICYVDIDHFKPFNEMNGHEIGKNADGLERLISLVLSTIEENFEMTPKHQSVGQARPKHA
ncbi:MAG: hypothetical protein V7764_07450, partial [Pseudomonas marincola]